MKNELRVTDFNKNCIERRLTRYLVIPRRKNKNLYTFLEKNLIFHFRKTGSRFATSISDINRIKIPKVKHSVFSLGLLDLLERFIIHIAITGYSQNIQEPVVSGVINIVTSVIPGSTETGQKIPLRVRN